MGYSEKEFWHDVNTINQKYDLKMISYEKRMQELNFYLSVFEKEHPRKAKSIRKTMGL